MDQLGFRIPTLFDVLHFFIYVFLPVYFLLSFIVSIVIKKVFSIKSTLLKVFISGLITGLLVMLFVAITGNFFVQNFFELINIVGILALVSLALSILFTFFFMVFYSLFMKSKLHGIIGIVLFVIVLVFFFPKDNNNYSENTSNNSGFIKCSCIGFEDYEKCMGIPYRCKEVSPQEVCGQDECIFLDVSALM